MENKNIMIRITKKQRETLKLVELKYSLTRISRELKINKSSASDRLRSLINKKLVANKNGTYRLTNSGIIATESCSGTSSVIEQKNIHSNEFNFDILRLPNHWYAKKEFFQGLDVKDVIFNKNANQAHIYFEDAQVRICPKKLKATIWIKKQVATTFNRIQSKVWDLFVKYYNMLECHAFKFDRTIISPNPHFADKGGFFAKLASSSTKTGFSIEVDDKIFKVDYSDGVAEEETSEEEMAARMEQLSESAFKSESTFEDLDKVIKLATLNTKTTTNLIRLQTQNMNIEPTVIKEGDKPLYFG